MADLALRDIGIKVISEIIDSFLEKSSVIIYSASRQHFGDLSGPFGAHLLARMVTTRYMLL